MKNRWFLIWSKPRMVARDLLDNDPYERVGIIVFLIAGLISGRRLGAAGFVLGPFLGIAIYYLYSYAMRWVGSWFGGTANNDQVRIAVGWGALTILQTTFVVALATLTYNLWWGKYMPTVAPYILGGLFIVLGIWSLTIQWRVMAEAHGFSLPKGFATHVLGFLVVNLPLLGLGYLLGDVLV